MSNWINKLVKKTGLEQSFSGFSTISKAVFQVLVVLYFFLISIGFLQNNKKIDDLINIMYSLALCIQTL